jgi:hypothetical protein
MQEAEGRRQKGRKTLVIGIKPSLKKYLFREPLVATKQGILVQSHVLNLEILLASGLVLLPSEIHL